MRIESNTAYDRVTWGFIACDVDSANDSVSQLGSNDCYSLAGTVLAVYSDEACTKEVCRVTLDEEGTLFNVTTRFSIWFTISLL